MKIIDYLKIINEKISFSFLDIITKIYEFKGKQDLYIKNHLDILENMMNVAKIQSVKSSNALEGIYTSDSRLNELINNSDTNLKNRNEREIAGYKIVLEIIHENYEFIEFNKKNILWLHNKLYEFSQIQHKGKFKKTENLILEIDENQNKKIRFEPVKSYEVEKYIDQMIIQYQIAKKEKIPPLILIPIVILDFLCIHPFEDGNGRLSRLLTLLLLYQNGFDVGKYISIEMLIEKSKDFYYDALKKSSDNWHQNQNNPFIFVEYLLTVILNAYQECESRFKLISEINKSKEETILNIIENSVFPISKSQIKEKIYNLSLRTIERYLKKLVDDEKIISINKGRNTKYLIK
ncbi:Fic family protein [Mesomycoplasma lagogenitalium]|uniref:Fic family protein n=1 Tax=Mesomycoplasma lagogenitalium TaxID=171286 RepID=A0ABY8LW04_9BACT|nr:Fic family protein [Mesomycoplasma lagogenitalium]WGI36718.1 Fic family protein [Mesomycoplasma lagogenitalium]